MSDSEDLKTHEETWQGFVKLLTYSTIAIVIALGLMALFLL